MTEKITFYFRISAAHLLFHRLPNVYTFFNHPVRFCKTLKTELFVIEQSTPKPSNKRNIFSLSMKIFFSLGHEDYDGLRVELYQDADVFLVCFDIGNPNSLESAEDMVRL